MQIVIYETAIFRVFLYFSVNEFLLVCTELRDLKENKRASREAEPHDSTFCFLD